MTNGGALDWHLNAPSGGTVVIGPSVGKSSQEMAYSLLD